MTVEEMIFLRLNFEANYARKALFWRWWRERGKGDVGQWMEREGDGGREGSCRVEGR